MHTLAGVNPRLRWKRKGKTGGNALGVGKTKLRKLQRAKRTAKERGADVTGKALLPGERATVFIIAVMSALCDSAIPALCVSSVFACLPLLWCNHISIYPLTHLLGHTVSSLVMMDPVIPRKKHIFQVGGPP